MALAEEFLRWVLRTVLDESAEDMAFFDERIQPGVRATLEHVASAQFAHLTYTEAIAALERSGESFEFPVKWGADLQSEHERWLTERHVGRPIVVTDYPKEIKAFYMYRNDDDRTVRAMDVLVPKVGEIIGGSQREDRLDVLRARLAECGLAEEHYGWYLDLRRFGSVPHAGFGLGFERLMLYLTGMANIRDVIPFPRVPGYAEF
jgi:asparaginyl-tRNA synthetase